VVAICASSDYTGRLAFNSFFSQSSVTMSTNYINKFRGVGVFVNPMNKSPEAMIKNYVNAVKNLKKIGAGPLNKAQINSLAGKRNAAFRSVNNFINKSIKAANNAAASATASAAASATASAAANNAAVNKIVQSLGGANNTNKMERLAKLVNKIAKGGIGSRMVGTSRVDPKYNNKLRNRLTKMKNTLTAAEGANRSALLTNLVRKKYTMAIAAMNNANKANVNKVVSTMVATRASANNVKNRNFKTIRAHSTGENNYTKFFNAAANANQPGALANANAKKLQNFNSRYPFVSRIIGNSKYTTNGQRSDMISGNQRFPALSTEYPTANSLKFLPENKRKLIENARVEYTRAKANTTRNLNRHLKESILKINAANLMNNTKRQNRAANIHKMKYNGKYLNQWGSGQNWNFAFNRLMQDPNLNSNQKKNVLKRVYFSYKLTPSGSRPVMRENLSSIPHWAAYKNTHPNP
jgi:hypothetical protein